MLDKGYVLEEKKFGIVKTLLVTLTESVSDRPPENIMKASLTI